MNEQIIGKIQNFLNFIETHPGELWGSRQLETESIARWTHSKLLQEIMDHPDQDAEKTVYQFWSRMKYFREMASSEKVKQIFQTVVDVLDTFLLNIKRG